MRGFCEECGYLIHALVERFSMEAIVLWGGGVLCLQLTSKRSDVSARWHVGGISQS